jgi:hypothetical protein
MDKFPEAFRRFEQQVNIRGLNKKPDGFIQLELMVKQWSPNKWIPTRKQVNALAREADKRGFKHVLTGEIDTYEVKRTRTGRKYRRRVRTTGYHGIAPATHRKQRRLSVKAVKVLVIHNYVKKGYSANRIVKELKNQGRGMRRKEVLKIVREAKNKQLKANAEKYTRKKYRKK